MSLDVIVPGRDFRITDGPIDGDAVPRVRLEVHWTPAVTLAAPHQRATTNLIAAVPVEAFYLGVGRILIRCPEGEILLVERIIPLENGIHLLHGARAAAAMRILPRMLGGIDVILDVLDVASPFEEQNAKASFGELLGGPAARDPGSDDDRIVTRLLLRGTGVLHRVLAVVTDWPAVIADGAAGWWCGANISAGKVRAPVSVDP